MANTTIFGWRIPDLPGSADGPAGIGNLARDAETTVNALNTKRVYFSEQKNHDAGTGNSNIGGWTNAGGFVGNVNGLTVPEAGIYTFYLGLLNLSRVTANPATGFQITQSQGASIAIRPGDVTGHCSWTGLMAAGGQMNLVWRNRETASIVALMLLTAVKVSA